MEYFFLFFVDLQEIRKLLETETGGLTCPSCKMPFDKGKKRKLIDNCGHGRCYSCMFKSEQCPVCRDQIYDDKKGEKDIEKIYKFCKALDDSTDHRKRYEPCKRTSFNAFQEEYFHTLIS